MTNRPRAIGTAAETAVCRYLQANGFPGAERPALHGALDQGDITGTPGIAWEVKAGRAAEQASDAQVAAWLAETEVERVNRGADVGVLVLKRAGKGPGSVGQWWVYLSGRSFVWLAARRRYGPSPGFAPMVQIRLVDVVDMLRGAGYGAPNWESVERLCSRCGVTIVPSRGGWTHVFPGADSYCGEPEPEATA